MTYDLGAASRQMLETAVVYAVCCAVPGDVVEFGCWQGDTAEVLAKVMAETAGPHDELHGIAQRKLWVFDSFQGFPAATAAPDLVAPHIKAGVWHQGSPAGGTPEAVAQRCGRHIGDARVMVVPGWFKDTLERIPAGTRFAVVHIDCDYYESTIQVLDHLFKNDMMSDGCTILFDDWYCNRGSPEFGEQKAWWEALTNHYVDYTDWGGYGHAGRRFIVHQ